MLVAQAIYDTSERRGESEVSYDSQRKNRMQMRNLGDMAAEVLKAAATGGNVEEAVKQGIETANDIEEGKVKQGFFGKLFRK